MTCNFFLATFVTIKSFPNEESYHTAFDISLFA